MKEKTRIQVHVSTKYKISTRYEPKMLYVDIYKGQILVPHASGGTSIEIPIETPTQDPCEPSQF